MDFLDFLTPKYDMVCEGTYYAELPDTPDNGGEYIRYEHIDVTSWQFYRMFSNVTENEKNSAAIRTVIRCDYKVGGYVYLQNGRFYQILSVSEEIPPEKKELLRIMKTVPGTKYTLRLVEIPNPWGLK